jgi:hypothetical protein
MSTGPKGKVVAFALCLVTVCYNLTEDVFSASQVPIIVGGSATEDACGSVGAVSGFKSRSSFLTVRRGPGISFSVIDSLPVQTVVFICAFHGDWYGIVYGKELSACAVSSPQPTKSAYHGPCHSGWVNKQYIRIVAG